MSKPDFIRQIEKKWGQKAKAAIKFDEDTGEPLMSYSFSLKDKPPKKTTKILTKKKPRPSR